MPSQAKVAAEPKLRWYQVRIGADGKLLFRRLRRAEHWRWYQVRIGADGKVSSCVPIDADGDADAQTFCVQAASLEAAVAAGLRKYRSACTRAAQARNRAAGKCGCGALCEIGKKHCIVCLNSTRRNTQRKRGKPIEELTPYVAPRPAAPDHRLMVLLEVRERWEKSPNNAQFSHWIAREIHALAGDAVFQKPTEETLPRRAPPGKERGTFHGKVARA